MFALIGLGNPGLEYEGTRHNVGFRVIDAIGAALDLELSPGHGEYLIGKTRAYGKPVLLIKPLTYMNNSGRAVADVTERYNLALDHILVVCDDFQLPLGTLRLRPKGSDGGHNGLYSIIYHLQRADFPRLRCGIWPAQRGTKKKFDMVQFVLSVFDKDEEPIVKQTVNCARDAVLVFVSEGLSAAMNKFNSPHQV